MALTAHNLFTAGVGDSFPVDAVSDDLGLHNFSTCIIIQPTNHVKFITDVRHRSAFSRCGLPSVVKHVPNIDSVTLSLLHPLNVGLQSTNQLLNQSIPRNVFSRRCSELILAVSIARLGVLIDDSWLGPRMLNPRSDELRFRILGEEFTCIRTHREIGGSLHKRLLARISTGGEI